MSLWKLLLYLCSSFWNKPQVCDGGGFLVQFSTWRQRWRPVPGTSTPVLPSGIFSLTGREWNSLETQHDVGKKRRIYLPDGVTVCQINWFTEVRGWAEEGQKLAEISSEQSCSICVSLRCNLLFNRLEAVDGWSAQSHRSCMFGEMGHEEKVTWHFQSIELQGACGLVEGDGHRCRRLCVTVGCVRDPLKVLSRK